MMRYVLALAVLAGPGGIAHAGRPCENKPLEVAQIENGMALAQATHAELDRSGAKVVLLARAGQDLTEYGLRWSHLGLAYRDTSGPGKAVWYVVHKLNHCNSPTADLYRQGLGEFFLDRPHRYEGIYAVLSPQVQEALLPVLRRNHRAATLHAAEYNMLAYPWSRQYQQSNQWVNEMLAAAAAPGQVLNREQAQQWLMQADYTPSTLRLSTTKRLGARIGMANVAFDDQPSASRFAGRIQTTTADSVFAWAARIGLAGPAVPIPLGERSFFLSGK